MREEGELEGHNKTLDEEPTLNRSYKFTWNIFRILDSQRQAGFESLQPISISDIASYFEMSGINDYDLRDDLLYFIAELDTVARTEFFKKQKASSDTK